MDPPISSQDNGWQRSMEDADSVLSHARDLRQDKRWFDYRIIVRSLVVNFESAESPAFMQVKGLGLVVFSEPFREGNLYGMHFGYYQKEFFRIKLPRARILKIIKPAGDMKKPH